MPRPGRAVAQAMNMRAADAIVSSAPNAMKIFPIRDVWSHAEGSLPEASVGAVDGVGLVTARATVRLDGVSCKARSTSLSWSEATTASSGAAWASVGLSAVASNMVLALAVIALALSPDESAEAICALALATDAGIADDATALLSTAFLASLLSEDFELTLADLRWA